MSAQLHGQPTSKVEIGRFGSIRRSLDSGGNYHSYIGDLARMGIAGEPDAEREWKRGRLPTAEARAPERLRPPGVGIGVEPWP
jgi:Xaa-Pro aminopeptidase